MKSGAGEFSLGVGGKIDPTKAVGTSDAKFGTRSTSGFFTINGVKITIDASSQIGITTISEESSYGKVAVLSLDETKLREALTNNPDGVARIFFNDVDLNGEVDKDAKGTPIEDGVTVRLDYYLQQLTDTKTISYGGRSVKAGLIPRQQNVLQGQIDDLEEQIEAFEERLAKREEQLYA